ncbi:hypothetical protein F4604DRAFT_1682993 [Suillus subluteus]|nr:hypothetical protein F4604DRAFT_1682993 [Suillus subluteus]
MSVVALAVQEHDELEQDVSDSSEAGLTPEGLNFNIICAVTAVTEREHDVQDFQVVKPPGSLIEYLEYHVQDWFFLYMGSFQYSLRALAINSDRPKLKQHAIQAFSYIIMMKSSQTSPFEVLTRCEQPELFAAIADGKTEPLNPVLRDIENLEKGVILTGHSAQKTSSSGGSIIVKQVGHTVLTVSSSVWEYLITLPRLYTDGLWYGSPYIELAETSYVQCSTWWLSTIESKGKGYFSGKSHTFKATLTPPSHIHTSPHVIEGTSHTMSKDLHSGATFHDVTSPEGGDYGCACGGAGRVREQEVVVWCCEGY